MNFIFDVGNVLIAYNPELFLRSLLNDPRQEEKMNEIIFSGPEWKKLDEGTITQEEASMVFCEREPEWKEIIEKVMSSLPGVLTPIFETIELLPAIKKAGHKLFYLSNCSRELSQHILKEYSFFSLFDGGIFSCDVRLLKPSPEIFLYFLNKYQLAAEDCLFFDDVEQNVDAAEKLGIKGVLFRSAQDAKQFLQ